MFAALSCLLAAVVATDVAFPQVLDDRLQLQLVAAEPDVVTPTGIAVDAQGRALVIESHTHFRPKDYQGPPADRILLLDDFEPATGKARRSSVWFEGTTHTMSLAIHHDGSVYVATRMEIFRLRDADGDGRADERTPICHLETPGNYPHNGLSGLAFDYAGNVYFGFGENLGAEYKLIGSDGQTLSGGGEGGNIYGCDAEGKNLHQLATGFWNPFGLGFDAFGRLFAVDNDPDSRPPCRLLHIIAGGDYGFRFRNGRKGVHPFTAWNGELPGTLPMVSGTGEAPCAVLAYESDNLPAEYRGDLLVTSWGDHRLERYRLTPRGASFGGEMTSVLLGNENFRPVGLALAPDGSLFMTDWVDKSYPLHGKGRVWRLSAKSPAQPDRPSDAKPALSSPHGPWREAAARKLTRSEAIEIAKTSNSLRARSLAGRATFATNENWGAALKLVAKKDGPSVLVIRHELERLSEAIARYRPEDFEKAAVNAEYLSLMLAERKIEKALEEQYERVGEWDPEAYANADQPIELRVAWLVVAMGELLGHPDLIKTPEGDDPFVAAVLIADKMRSLRGLRGDEPKPLVGPVLRALLGAKKQPTNLEKLQAALRDQAPESSLISRTLPIALARADNPTLRPLIRDLLQSPAELHRLMGILWVGEARLGEYRGELEALLTDPRNTRQLFTATLAALDRLAGQQPADPKRESAGDAYIARLVHNAALPPSTRRFAIRTLAPTHPALTAGLLTGLIADGDAGLRLEAIRTIRLRPDVERWPELRELAQDAALPAQVRCEAIMGLSPAIDSDRQLLLALAGDSQNAVASEALRALRGQALREDEKQRLASLAATADQSRRDLIERALARELPRDLPPRQAVAAWLARAAGAGNAEAGERVFFHARVGQCAKCHEFAGRGERVGPDLSTIGRSSMRERLVQSIVDPSREIAPQFTNYVIRMKDGQTLTGMHVGDEVDGRMRFVDSTGRTFHVHPNEIEHRQPSDKSIMPDGLADHLTPQELRDLLAFLAAEPAGPPQAAQP